MAASQSLHPSLEGARLVVSSQPKGIKVDAIDPNSPAARSGLQPGDIIFSANNMRVESLEQLKKALERRDQSVLRVRRGNMALYLVLR